MKKKRQCSVIVYNSFLDPLFQNLMLQYMQTLVANSNWQFHLITFEQEEYKINKQERNDIKLRLREGGIIWYDRVYHSGNFILLKKFYDFFTLSYMMFWFRLRGVKVLWSFANIAASIGWVYSRIMGFKTVIFSYEPHSDFMVELGIWKPQSVSYRLLNFMENKAGLDADFVLTGTSYMETLMKMRKKRGKVYKAPTSVREDAYFFDERARGQLIHKYGFDLKQRLILYMGKFGGLYYDVEIIGFFKILQKELALPLKFIVISPTPFKEIEKFCNEVEFNVDDLIFLPNLSQTEIRSHLSVAHMAISAIPPTPSQRYRSPTKVAEYLLCGLPFITCKGVSEDDLVVKEHGVGVVVDDFSEVSILKSLPEIEKILNQDKAEMAIKCRSIGLRYRGKTNVDNILKEIFSKLET